MSQEDFNHDRLTYSESRTINMGDYESTQCFFSFSTTVKERYGGKKSVAIKESASVELSKLTKTKPEDFTKIAKRLVRRVRTVLDEQELQLRTVACQEGFNEEEENEKKRHYLVKKKKAGKFGQ